MTDHYQASALVDFARGLVDEPTRSDISSHVADCARCDTAARSLGRLATAKLPPEPPAEVLERARAIFAHPHPGMSREVQLKPGGLRPRLLFDSASAALPSGTRRAGGGTRRLLYEAGRYFLDLDLSPQVPSEGPAQLVLVGQLVDREEPGRGLAGLPVQLVGQSGSAAHTNSNALGEFELTSELTPPLCLAVPLDEGGAIEVELPFQERGAGC